MNERKLTYAEFIQAKKPVAQLQGFNPKSEPHPSLFPHQRAISLWMINGGRRADFMSFGLGKTRVNIQLGIFIAEAFPKLKYLIIAPLGVRQEFTKEEGPAMGVEIPYVTTDAEMDATTSPIVITNYERVRDGGITITPDRIAGAGLDEAAVLRSYGSKTTQLFLDAFKKIPYRFVFTAAPSPNRYKELIHYAGFLGVMDTGQALTRFFQRDSKKAGNLTLHPHMEEDFFEWMASWSCWMQKPSDLGFPDTGYDLPEMKVHWHCVPVDHKKAWNQLDSWGQRQLFLDKSNGLADLANVKRDTMIARLAKATEIIEDAPSKNFILWHDLEDERRLIQKVIPGVKVTYGSQPLEAREEIILEFSHTGFPCLATKPVLAGSGCNLQRHCADMIFLGSSYKFSDFIQACHRIYRFGQTKTVNIHIIFSESEDPVIDSLKKKWAQHNEIVARMQILLKKFKLDLTTMQIIRKTGGDRVEVKGKLFRAINNDCILELMPEPNPRPPEDQAAIDHIAGVVKESGGTVVEPEKRKIWQDNCVDLIVTSIPFGNQYEYSPNNHDFGFNESNAKFFEQMDYLVPNLFRVLKPGRLACMHVKDRIRFGKQYGTGVPTVDRFSDKTADIMEKHGFFFMGRIAIDTDVVRENAQTYRLGWSENAKDSTKMGVGMQEYVLLFRKPHSDLTKAYADVPVMKDKGIYLRADWQIDASGFWKSDGNRLPDPDIIAGMPTTAVRRVWVAHCKAKGYRWKEHVKLCKNMEDKGRLPASFMLFPPISNNPGIWTDIARMRVLNSEQTRKREMNHTCPLQLDIVNRCIGRYSNPGDIVMDPFAGIFTVPYCAMQMGRIGWGIELAPEYFRCGVGYCEQAERERIMPDLFDFAEAGTGVVKGSGPETEKNEAWIYEVQEDEPAKT